MKDVKDMNVAEKTGNLLGIILGRFVDFLFYGIAILALVAVGYVIINLLSGLGVGIIVVVVAAYLVIKFI